MANKPVIGAAEEFAHEMFWTLHGGRQIGMQGYQAIPLVEVMAYCALAGIGDPEERMALLRVVKAMDAEFCAIVAEKAARAERQSVRR